MKEPAPSNERFGSHGVELMSWNVQVWPSSVDVAWNVSMSASLGSLRLSNQMAWSVPWAPALSAAIDGKNWSCGAGSPFPSTLRGRASLQVCPWSVDCTKEMSAPVVAAFTLFWKT